MSDKEKQERAARDQMCKDIKIHHEQKGEYRSGESIEREVSKIQEKVRREKSHEIYK